MKKKLAWIMVVAMVMSFAFAVPAYAAEGEFTVHVQVPADWTPSLWAWNSADGVDTPVFAAWPGQVLTADPDNAGWFYYSIPNTTNRLIVSNNGTPQTNGIEIQTQELWYTVTANEDGSLAEDIVYEAPEGFGAAAVEDTTATDTAATTDTTATDTAATDVAKTGVVGLGLVYGLGVLATGAVALKKRNK